MLAFSDTPGAEFGLNASSLFPVLCERAFNVPYSQEGLRGVPPWGKFKPSSVLGFAHSYFSKQVETCRVIVRTMDSRARTHRSSELNGPIS